MYTQHHSSIDALDEAFAPQIFFVNLFVNLRQEQEDTFRTDVARGLAHGRKSLMPKYLYDKRGSELFEQITLLPEYYLTRSEQAIMDANAAEMLALAEEDFWLVELGAGSGKKTRTLLSAMTHSRTNARYLPIDISEAFLQESSQVLQHDFPAIPITAVCAEFLQGVEYIAQERDNDAPFKQLVIYFPGSTLGNLTRKEQMKFLQDLRGYLRSGDVLLLSVDMSAARAGNSHSKTASTLHAAYNDAQGITAEFNLNILHRINSECDAAFPVEDYRHVAFYNSHEARVELYLESTSYHSVWLNGYEVRIAAGERIHTEYSHKFDDTMIANMASLADFRVRASWHDAPHYFGVYWLQVP
ncbi:MAG: L-histidine N(alpha)-methyltransferase [Candidatus Kapaibacterium sp.]|nr:MAG: L-histidine N(alpha)-methyltransferase [Candidatus Kapabacteria bacterium]